MRLLLQLLKKKRYAKNPTQEKTQGQLTLQNSDK